MADPADPCPCQEGTRAPRPSSPRPRRAPFPSPADTPFTVSTEAVPPKRQVSQGCRLTKNDQFFKNFFNLALGPQRQEESCRRWPSDEFAEASVPTDIAAPRGGTAAISCQHWGGRATAWQRDLRLGPSCPLCKSGWSSRRAPGILELIAHLQLVAATCNPRTPHQAGVTPRPLQKANTAHPLRPRRAPSPSLEGKRNTPCAASGPKARKRRTLTSGRQARRRSLENPFVHRCIRSSIRQIFAQRRAQCPPGSSSRRPQRCRGTWCVRGRGRVAWEMTRGA